MFVKFILWHGYRGLHRGEEYPPASPSLVWLDAAQRTIAADGGLSFLRTLGRKADLWIGDGDSLEGSLAGWSDWYGRTMVLSRDKDETDTEAAVRVALEEGADEVWLLGGAGGRMDHWWANLRLAASRPELTRWLTRHEEICVAGKGRPQLLPPGVVSIFPIGDGPWKMSSTGLRWPVDRVDFHNWHSLSNEVSSEGARLVADSGRFLIMRPWVTGEVQ